jgi:serine/threonine protein kinase
VVVHVQMRRTYKARTPEGGHAVEAFEGSPVAAMDDSSVAPPSSAASASETSDDGVEFRDEDDERGEGKGQEEDEDQSRNAADHLSSSVDSASETSDDGFMSCHEDDEQGEGQEQGEDERHSRNAAHYVRLDLRARAAGLPQVGSEETCPPPPPPPLPLGWDPRLPAPSPTSVSSSPAPPARTIPSANALIGVVLSGGAGRPSYRVEALLNGDPDEAYFSCVYRAVVIATGEVVAIKVLCDRQKNDQNRIRRWWQHEVERLLKLKDSRETSSCPNVIRMRESFRDAKTGSYCIVFDYHPHGSLLRYIEGRGRWASPREVLNFLRHLLKALVACHAAGIIHLDVELRNIVIDAAWRLVLCDFGISALMASSEEGGGLTLSEWQAMKDIHSRTSEPGVRRMFERLEKEGVLRAGEKAERAAKKVAVEELATCGTDVWALACIMLPLLLPPPRRGWDAFFRAVETKPLDKVEEGLRGMVECCYYRSPEEWFIADRIVRVLTLALHPDPKLRPSARDLLEWLFRGSTLDSSVVWRNDELSKVIAAVDQVLRNPSPQAPRLVVIAGAPGVGKSLIARQLMEVKEARGNSVAWAEVGQGRQAREVIIEVYERLLKRAFPPHCADVTLGGAERELERALADVKHTFLVVLSKVWEAGHVQSLERAMGGRGCLVITTCCASIASNRQACRITVGPLDEPGALRLLQSHGGSRIPPGHGDEEVCRQIVRACAGWPLVLAIVGRLKQRLGRGWAEVFAHLSVRTPARIEFPENAQGGYPHRSLWRALDPTVSALEQASDESARQAWQLLLWYAVFKKGEWVPLEIISRVCAPGADSVELSILMEMLTSRFLIDESESGAGSNQLTRTQPLYRGYLTSRINEGRGALPWAIMNKLLVERGLQDVTAVGGGGDNNKRPASAYFTAETFMRHLHECGDAEANPVHLPSTLKVVTLTDETVERAPGGALRSTLSQLRFSRLLRLQIRHVDLSRCSDRIGEVLERVPTLQALDLRGCENLVAAELAKALRKPEACRSLTELNLRKTGLGDWGVMVLMAALQTGGAGSALRFLNLRGNDVGDWGAATIVNVIRHPRACLKLKELKLRNNRISEAGRDAITLGTTSRGGRSIEVLKLGGQEGGPQQANAGFFAALGDDAGAQMANLREHDDRCNHVNDAKAAVMAVQIQQGSFVGLAVLILKNNDLTDDGVVSLAPALGTHCPWLEVLSLSRNDVVGHGLGALVDQVRAGRLTQLRDLNLRGNKVGAVEDYPARGVRMAVVC